MFLSFLYKSAPVTSGIEVRVERLHRACLTDMKCYIQRVDEDSGQAARRRRRRSEEVGEELLSCMRVVDVKDKNKVHERTA